MQDAGYVRQAFAGIARRYVLANHVLSLGIDVFGVVRPPVSWPPGSGDLLDLATGSGDLLESTLQTPARRLVHSRRGFFCAHDARGTAREISSTHRC
jgi:ubiquinone/menaquinone biosynthesis C-methylase UbiE